MNKEGIEIDFPALWAEPGEPELDGVDLDDVLTITVYAGGKRHVVSLSDWLETAAIEIARGDYSKGTGRDGLSRIAEAMYKLSQALEFAAENYCTKWTHAQFQRVFPMRWDKFPPLKDG